jgi:hypothetical protein
VGLCAAGPAQALSASSAASSAVVRRQVLNKRIMSDPLYVNRNVGRLSG